MRTKYLVTSTLLAALCGTPYCAAAPASAQGQPAVVKPMTRKDVDVLLREAKSSLEQGELDAAERLIAKAESARIHYSMFHIGATPSSLRRDLNRARRAAGQTGGSATAGGDSRSPLGLFERNDAPNTGNVDPFMARSREASASEGTLAEPAMRGTAAAGENDRLAESAAPPAQSPQRLPSLGGEVVNPFAKSAKSDVTPARYESTPESADKGPQGALAAGADPSWSLPDSPAAATAGENQPTAKQQALDQMREARKALSAGKIDEAERISRAVTGLGVMESEFLPNEDRPSVLAWDIVRAKQNRSKQAAPTGDPQVAAARYSESAQSAETPKVETAQFTEDPSFPQAQSGGSGGNEDLPAPVFEVPADADAQLKSPADTSSPRATQAPSTLVDAADQKEQLLYKQVQAEVFKRMSEARRLQTDDPERAMTILEEGQQYVKASGLSESLQRDLLTRIEGIRGETEKFAKKHSEENELDKQNEKVLQDLDRERETERKIKQEIADGIQEFNKLRDEHRYAEAEIVARRLYELDPLDPTTQQVLQTAKFIRREMMNRELSLAREEGNWNTLTDVEKATIPNVGDDNPLVFDQKHWDAFAKKRTGKDRQRRRTARELEIEKKLKMPVQLRYEDAPLSQVVDELSKLAGINIYLDPRGMAEENVTSETTVDLPLNSEISLESALNLILGQLHLSYIIKDDVLKITSEQLAAGELVQVTYNVADLVIPIPNFAPNSSIGLQGLINEAHAATGANQRMLGGAAPSVLVNGRPQQSASATDQVLAQQFNPSASGGMSPNTVPIGAGPGGMGAGANADFDSLIDLIVSTVSTETWAENGGGEAEIRPFPTNLSLVISQTQAVHEEIADLLEQLRRLQDLQVTIEVRFIRLNDTFFERIGVDFDMDINDNGYNGDPLTTNLQPFGPNSNTVGVVRQATGDLPVFTTDLDIPFRQDSFQVAVPPPFAGFDANSAARMGFAILSDLEAYFLIEAAQGDRRTNVLNAPKVTLFNGQQAFVADATSRPFVVGVIPVVGEFAAAQQPVIVVLNEGTMMTIQAVVSEDRRYVRMTIVPFFTQIGDVDTFTFEGSTSTSSSSSSSDNDDGESEEETEEQVRSGVTVQLPAFSFVSVVTTVSVPDGGTVLLGGIKRLSEGRNEFGVPLLSKVPYVNRLFRNVGIGRSTDSLMMMVTPRIIIQEEEEERLGIQVP